MTSASVSHGAARDRLTRLLVTDFCPWANRYVYWLKEPVGWFMIAWTLSLLVGLFISPAGWTLASVIAAVVLVGMIWPWAVVRAAGCRLRPSVSEIHEGQACDLILSVRNRWPLPLWGLAIEGYLDRDGDAVEPTIALASVPMSSDAEYRLRVSPWLRGRYPSITPQISCSMPFGIWTARRPLRDCELLTVFPSLSRVQDDPQRNGGRHCEAGTGLRRGQAGEPLGVREFRSGDRLRSVHWIHTARTGTLTVSERGGPHQQPVDIVLDAGSAATQDPERRLFHRHALARRVRVAASLAMALHSRHVPLRLVIGDRVTPIAGGAAGRRRLLTLLAEVPADGMVLDPQVAPPQLAGDRLTLRVERDSIADTAAVEVFVERGPRLQTRVQRPVIAEVVRIVEERSLDSQLTRFWREAGHADFVS